MCARRLAHLPHLGFERGEASCSADLPRKRTADSLKSDFGDDGDVADTWGPSMHVVEDDVRHLFSQTRRRRVAPQRMLCVISEGGRPVPWPPGTIGGHSRTTRLGGHDVRMSRLPRYLSDAIYAWLSVRQLCYQKVSRHTTALRGNWGPEVAEPARHVGWPRSVSSATVRERIFRNGCGPRRHQRRL